MREYHVGGETYFLTDDEEDDLDALVTDRHGPDTNLFALRPTIVKELIEEVVSDE